MFENLADFYDKELDKDVKDFLSKIEYAGSFYSSGTFKCGDSEMPTVDIKKVCTLKYPVPEDQTKMIIGKCEQAPHGKGIETVVDTSVRKVWQLEPKAIKLTGMDKILALILPKISLELGLGPQDKVKANFYKLLAYDKGSFFLPHKDTEKEEKMFGTLVISLPSIHKGGDLIIRHTGTEQTISMDVDSGNDKTIRYCGFYADCEHEVKEITEGNRICLVYNLCRTGRQLFPQTIDVGSIVKSAQVLPQIESGFIKYFEKRQDPLFVLFEHHYPISNFSSKKLKGRDIVLTNFLNLISKNISCDISLGIIEITENGYLHDDNAKDRDIPKTPLGENSKDTANYSIDCICIVDLYGNLKENRIHVDVVLGELKGSKSIRKMVTETTGNEGSTYEKLYHRAAIILQPTKPYNPIKPVKSEDNTQQQSPQESQSTTTATTTTAAKNKLDEPIKVEQPTTTAAVTTDNKVEEQPSTTTATDIKVEGPIKTEQTTTTTATAAEETKQENKTEDASTTSIENKVIDEPIKVDEPTTTTITDNNIKIEDATTSSTENKVIDEPMKTEQPTATATDNQVVEDQSSTTRQSENIESDQPLKKQKME